MATTGGSADPTFVDTNVLIQAAITTAPRKRPRSMLESRSSGQEPWASTGISA